MEIEQIKFDERCKCAYEAAELIMIACDFDFEDASQLVKLRMKQAPQPEFADFYQNVFDGLSAVYERDE